MHLTATPADIGMIRSASGVGSLLAVIPAGFVVERIGARRAFHFGSLIDVLCVLSFSSVAEPVGLAALGFVDSAFRSLCFTSVTAIFFASLPRFGMGRVGWHKGVLSVGLSFIGPVLAGALLGRGSFNANFGVVVGLTVLSNLLMLFIEIPASHLSLRGRTKGAAARLAELWAMARHPYVALCLTTEVVVTGTFTTFSTFILVLAVQDLHLSPAVASLLSAVEGVSFIAAVFAAGGIVQRLSPRTAVLLGIAIVAPSLVAFGLTKVVPLLFGLALMLGLGLGLLNLITTTCAGTHCGGTGSAVGLFMASASLGGASGPASAGLLAGSYGVASAFLAFVPLYGLLALALLVRRRGWPISAPSLTGQPAISDQAA
jgi:predicted MFS family arabinose efflux permease